MDDASKKWLEVALKQANGDEIDILSAVLILLDEDIGIDLRLVEPLRKRLKELVDRRFRGRHGGRRRSLQMTLELAKAAAQITYCREKKIRLHGKTPAEVQKFRDELSRGRATAAARKFYELFLKELHTTKR